MTDASQASADGVFIDTTIRLIGNRAHALHNLVAYSMLCIFVTSIAYAPLGFP